ncbi:MAG TPA: DUF1846 domain-containing protein [Candidatus Anammoximicrobium sp.]|nr:DUF1846 domain-containing protein [Candidatus Anammoximicrobium sp.]
MMDRIGFDNGKYLEEQTAAILERVRRFDNKLYLEFGGKLLFDYHAARVLPGFDANVKMRLLAQLKDKAEILLCIHAGAIERKKMRADFGITYDADAMKLIDDLRDWGIELRGVVVTRFDEQPGAVQFKNKLQRRGIPVYTHRSTKGYPADAERIVSSDGYGANPYIETEKPLVVVTGPGPGSGKLATCLSQLYHDHRHGIRSGYAKFETFPIWNLPLSHPVNVAYEAATADLHDVNMIDPFHLEAYGQTAVNYNRDIEAFPVLHKILERITGGEPVYRSPTEMGVNRATAGIVNDEAVQAASRSEVIRRYFRYASEYAMGLVEERTVQRVQRLLEVVRAKPEDRRVVVPAREAAEQAQQQGKGNEGVFCGAAIELPDGTIVTGKNSPLMHAASSVVINAVKRLARLPDSMHLLAPTIIECVAKVKKDILGQKTVSLDLEETLIALGISITTNPTAQLCLDKLKDLRGCDVHITHIPTPGDEAGLRRLGVHLTSDPNFSTKNLFVS